MRKLSFIVMLLLICSCGSKQQIPEWKDKSSRQLESYKNYFLTDKESVLEPHFVRARKTVASSNDLNLLATVYLTSYALHVAVLDDFDDTDFLQINKLQPDSSAFAYYNFIKGNFSAADYMYLPSAYRSLLLLARNNDLLSAVREIKSISDPLSRIVACGVWVKYLPYDDNILLIAIDTSAEHGWVRPLFAYLTRLQQYYLDHQEPVKAQNIKERLELLRK